MTNKELQQEVNLLRGQVSSLEEEVEGLTAKLNRRTKKRLVSPSSSVDEQVNAVMERMNQREEERGGVRRELDLAEVPSPRPVPAPSVNYFDNQEWTTVTHSGIR